MKHLEFDDAAKLETLSYIDANYRFLARAWKMIYTNDDDADNEYILKRRPHTRLMILICKTVFLETIYKEKGLPREVMLDTLSDLTLRQRLYRNRNGKLGLNEEDVLWLKHIYRLNIFKLGSLQFEKAKMKYLPWKGLVYREDVAQIVPEGVPILDVHIRRGVDFSPESVDRSFAWAEQFFTKHFPEHHFKAYTCNSWMLYSGNSKILPPSSNILNFANRFMLIAKSKDKSMAVTFIYGKRFRAKRDYPQTTRLQKCALQNMGNLGVGCGLIWREIN